MRAYASGVLCQDVWLFRLLRDCHCEDYKSACLRSVPLLKSPAMGKHRGVAKRGEHEDESGVPQAVRQSCSD